MLTAAGFAALVDHTLLKPEATAAQIDSLCDQALQAGTAAVCVNSLWVPAVAARLAGSTVAACSVVGFPLGAMSPQALAAETTQAVADGAAEIDMVIPVGPLQSGADDQVVDYIGTARAAAGDGIVLKVILETALLSADQVVAGCRAAMAAGADFVKTSTGFNPAGGATTEAVSVMRRTVGDGLGVKASGGIRTLADVERMVDAGASRLGMSATLAIMAELAEAGR